MNNETWRVIPSLEERYEVCLETSALRATHNKKPLKLNPNGYYNSSWGVDGVKFRWGRSATSLLDEVFPFWWIRELEEGEEAKACYGFPGYFITTFGRVYSTHQHQWIKLAVKEPYYYQFSLYLEGKRKKCYSHTLVGRTFLPEWEEGLFILHRDETLSYPEINHPENLWAGTQKDNVLDAMKKERQAGWVKFDKPP